ncbi:hypothetical protein RHGRI_030600 [Rhododendron griersonianum]|uniref:Uncharacterized protein n=1 Tax=Rhododendron griersonianum TaxID=479676 RepID=A0AAV6I821_9ERIC|nr:hypothetical protein RHGRI_030600 [Rhododendron griersonianum]
MHHRDCAIANGYPSAGAHHQGDELTSQQGGISRKEHQCIMEEEGFQHQCIIEVVFRRDSAIANKEPSTGARHLGDKLLPPQGGIPWATQPNGYPSAGANHQGDELTSQQGGIPRKEHQCIMEEPVTLFRAGTPMHHRDGAIADREPSASAHRLGDKLTPQQGGIPWATQRGIRNQRPLASYAFPCGDTNASSGLCHSQRISIGRRSPPRRRAYLSARRHPPKGTPMHHGGRRLTTKGQCHSQRITVNRRSPSWRQASPSTRRHPLGCATWH